MLSLDIIPDDLLPVHILALELSINRVENQDGGVAVGAEIGSAPACHMGLSSGPGGAATANSTMPSEGLNPNRREVDGDTQKP